VLDHTVESAVPPPDRVILAANLRIALQIIIIIIAMEIFRSGVSKGRARANEIKGYWFVLASLLRLRYRIQRKIDFQPTCRG